MDRLRALFALPNVSAVPSEVIRTKPILEGEHLPDFWARDLGNELYIFIANPNSQDLSLPLTYGQSFSEETQVRKASVTFNDLTTEIELSFRPYQSLILNVSGDGEVSFIDVEFNPGVPDIK